MVKMCLCTSRLPCRSLPAHPIQMPGVRRTIGAGSGRMGLGEAAAAEAASEPGPSLVITRQLCAETGVWGSEV